MGAMTLRFTECCFLQQVWVDVHLVAGEADVARLGRLIFTGPRGLVAWLALAKVLRDHGHALIDGIGAVITSGPPDTVNYQAIPPAIMRGMLEHMEHGAPQGGYLTSVLENNLVEATGRADVPSLAALHDTAAWLWNHAPSECWGSPAKVGQWRQAHRQVEALGRVEQGPRPAEATP